MQKELIKTKEEKCLKRWVLPWHARLQKQGSLMRMLTLVSEPCRSPKTWVSLQGRLTLTVVESESPSSNQLSLFLNQESSMECGWCLIVKENSRIVINIFLWKHSLFESQTYS
jgi:hypothetical protein